MQCPRCQAAIAADASFCPKCGAALEAGEAGASPLAPAAKGAPEGEQQLWEGGYCSKAMVGTWVLLTVVSVALVVVAVVVAGVGTAGIGMPLAVIGALVIAAVLWAIGGMVLLMRKWSVRYKLTNQRFVHRRGILSATTDRIELLDVDDITFHQGFVERMMGVGTIRMRSSDATHPELVLIGIDDVGKIADMIDNARRKERRRHGLHIEAI